MNADMEALWNDLAASKTFRAAFVAAHVSQTIPMQIRLLMEQQDIRQQSELARRSGVDQATISRALDPDYGALTLNTCVRIAAGLDVAFVGHFVPFSELLEWIDDAENRTSVAMFSDDRLFEGEDEREEKQRSMMNALCASLDHQQSRRAIGQVADPFSGKFAKFGRALRMQLNDNAAAQSLVTDPPGRINPADQIVEVTYGRQ